MSGCQTDKTQCKAGRCVNVEKTKSDGFWGCFFFLEALHLFFGCSCDTHVSLLVYFRKTSPGGKRGKPAATRSACTREVEG